MYVPGQTLFWVPESPGNTHVCPAQLIVPEEPVTVSNISGSGAQGFGTTPASLLELLERLRLVDSEELLEDEFERLADSEELELDELLRLVLSLEELLELRDMDSEELLEQELDRLVDSEVLELDELLDAPGQLVPLDHV